MSDFANLSNLMNTSINNLTSMSMTVLIDIMIDNLSNIVNNWTGLVKI